MRLRSPKQGCRWAIVCAPQVSGGGYAEYCVAPVAQCLPVPEGLSDIEAASLPETFFTVWSNVFDRARLQPGETLLVQGGSSGIGVTAIQLARALGAQVIVTAGSDEKMRRLLAARGPPCHQLPHPRLCRRGAAHHSGPRRGCDSSDMVAGSYIEREVPCLAMDGRLVVIAVQGGVQAQFNAAQVLTRRLTITGSTLRPQSVAFKAAIA